MYKIKQATKFKKDLRKILYNESYKSEFTKVISKLQNGEILDEKYKNHSLKGEYNGFMECHIKPDLLLIYKYEETEIILYLLKLGKI